MWLDPIIDRGRQEIKYEVREGGTPPDGTYRNGRGVCIATGTPISAEEIKEHARSGNWGIVPLAVVRASDRGRTYSTLTAEMIWNSGIEDPTGGGIDLSTHSQYMAPPRFGLNRTSDLFTPRQLAAMSTFSELIPEVRRKVLADSPADGRMTSKIRLRDGGSGAEPYSDAIATYLALAVGKLADLNNALVVWQSDAECPVHLFGRQVYPMSMDFAEANPLGTSSGSWKVMVDGILRAFRSKAWPLTTDVAGGRVEQRDARAPFPSGCLLSTDPPYYAAVPYADLADFFIPWHRVMLREIWPGEMSTLASPKQEELVADVERWGGRDAAAEIFESGMQTVLQNAYEAAPDDYPIAIFYALKQVESSGQAPSGWEAFLASLIAAGWMVTGTWPVKTERMHRLRGQGSAALASSIVVAARKRPTDSPIGTRSELIEHLRRVLPEAVWLLQQQSIAPVDLAQAVIGPGMAVFSSYARIVAADGSDIGIGDALQLINGIVEEALSSEETEFDGDTRWALTWFEQYGLNRGPFGDAETLSKAKGTSVAGVIHAGIAEQSDGKVRLLERGELDSEWDPAGDSRLTVWEVTQHLIVGLEESEVTAADLLRRIGPGMGERARMLAYLLFQKSDQKGWSSEAVAYNSLVQAWRELTRLAASDSGPEQQTFGE